ncbi:MAG: peptidoglycan-binding domain-containing protein [Pseudomonadota bacterium]
MKRLGYAWLGATALALTAAGCAELDKSRQGGVVYDEEALGAAPIGARPGACYAKVLKPAKFDTVYDTVLDEPGGKRVKIIPATYRTVTEKVLVQESFEREIEVPPTYKVVTEEVVVRPEYEKLEVIPPVFKTIKEEVVVDAESKPPVTKTDVHYHRKEVATWKHPSDVDPYARVISRRQSDGHLLVVEEKVVEVKKRRTVGGVRKKVVTRRELLEPERTRKVQVPAVTKTVTRRVIDEPAGTRIEIVPPQYDIITRREVVTPEQTIYIDVDDTYKEVPSKVLVEQASVVWSEVICDNETSAGVVRTVQDRLFALGYYNGPIDGSSGPTFRNAVKAYQEDNDLATGGLTIETVNALGVNI